MVLQEQVMQRFFHINHDSNSWDEALLLKWQTLSQMKPGKYHEFQRRGKTGIYQGLTFWSPNINIFVIHDGEEE